MILNKDIAKSTNTLRGKREALCTKSPSSTTKLSGWSMIDD